MIINTTPGARRISAPKILTNDGEVGEIRTTNVEDFGYIELKLKNTVGADRKTVKLELDFEYSRTGADGQITTSGSTEATLLSEHTIAVAGCVPLDGQMILLLIKPKILEREFSKIGD